MMIRQDFDQLPPKGYMMQVMDELSKEYCWLWDKKDPDNRIFMRWDEVTKYFHKNTFRTNLRKLNNKGLLSYDENNDGIAIELVGWDAIAE